MFAILKKLLPVLPKHYKNFKKIFDSQSSFVLFKCNMSCTSDENDLLHLTYGGDKVCHGYARRPELIPPLDVIHHCSDYIVVNKPFDININSNDATKLTVETLVCRLFPEKIDHECANSFRFTHRLDNATSGVLVLALNKRAAAKISNAFRRHRVTKHYVALVRGHVLDRNMLISVPIGEDGIQQKEGVFKMCVKDSPGCKHPKKCVTKIITLEYGLYDAEPATKVLLLPITGRTHQLRVHCKHVGHRIVGDYGYSDRTDSKPYRMMLHSHRLYTKIKGEPFDMTAEDPFVPEIDSKWKPTKIINTYQEFVLSNDKVSDENLSDDTVLVKDLQPKPDLSQQLVEEFIKL